MREGEIIQKVCIKEGWRKEEPEQNCLVLLEGCFATQDVKVCFQQTKTAPDIDCQDTIR